MNGVEWSGMSSRPFNQTIQELFELTGSWLWVFSSGWPTSFQLHQPFISLIKEREITAACLRRGKERLAGKENEWRLMESIGMNFSAAEGPPAHNPPFLLINGRTHSANNSINSLHEVELIGVVLGLPRSRRSLVPRSINTTSTAPFHFQWNCRSSAGLVDFTLFQPSRQLIYWFHAAQSKSMALARSLNLLSTQLIPFVSLLIPLAFHQNSTNSINRLDEDWLAIYKVLL